jgi:retron-type reverse transcriptase
MEAIVSLRKLSWLLGVPRERLIDVASRGNASYRVKRRPDKKGKLRTFEIPNSELMEIQRRIVRCLLSQYDVSPAAHGAIKGRSPRTNAEAHLGQSLLVKVDVRDFFPWTRHGEVFAMFRRDFAFGTDVASILTSLTTFKGHLPQGAATTP